MKHDKRRIYKMRMFINVTFVIIFTVLGSTQGVVKIQAQSSGIWAEPVNLSQSGSASEPAIVVDSDGTYHTVWSDEFSGNKYVSGDGVEWSQPVVVDLPSKDAIPELLADKEGFIHAFWLDSRNVLFYSTVRATDFTSTSSWTPPVPLAESAFDFNITLDQKGNLHLIYLRPMDSTEFPAGIYYRKLVNEAAGGVWSSSTLLYSSLYFRSLELEGSSGDIETRTNYGTVVDIATSTIDGAVQVYAVWDNRPRERVYLAISPDGGQTWGSPEEIDKPESGLGYNSTGKILVEAYDQDVLLVWQRSNTGGVCSQHYQKSNDGGVTWSQPSEVSSGSPSCSQDDQLISDGNGLIYLWTTPQSQAILYAWDRQQWSNPQVQNEISTFIDPETQKPVVFDCRQPVLEGSQRLAVAGCDTGGGGDIWFTNRELNDVGSWFSTESTWSEAEEFVTSQIEIDAPVLITAPDNKLLALWSQAELGTGTTEHAAIHLATWDGETWTIAGPIFRSSQGNLTQPAAAIDGEGLVLAVWSASEDGKLYFSRANIASAQNLGGWSEPIALPISQSIAGSPRISVNKSGTIDVVYSVPVNEGRGIYLISSGDGGETWSSPVPVFDGAAANWQMVDFPQLVETIGGELHMLWSQRSILDSEGSLGLYYARSEDNGNSWSEPVTVTNSKVMWSQISPFEQESLVRIWQEGNQLRPVIKYQFSQDNGINWSTEESLGSFGEKSLMAHVVTTPPGNLHMLQVVQASSGDLFLRDWLWENGRWSINEFFNLTGGLLEEATSMESTVSSDGNLAMILSAKTKTQPGSPDRYGLFFTSRAVGLPAINSAQPTTTINATTPPSVTPLPSPIGTSVLTPVATLVVQSSPTPELSPLASIEPPGSSTNSFLSVGGGVFLSALIIIAVVAFGVWRVRSNR